MNKLIVISGCSGGGKSTIVDELSRQGYSVIEEIGRQVVKEYGDIDPDLRCKLIVTKSIEAYQQAQQITRAKDNLIFFDRSFIDGISYFQTKGIHQYDHYIDELRFYQTIFMTPPWEEIFTQDLERKHYFDDSVKEYDSLLDFYPKCGYQIMVLPKRNVKERIQWMLSQIHNNSGSIDL